jgi:hypothetical protein
VQDQPLTHRSSWTHLCAHRWEPHHCRAIRAREEGGLCVVATSLSARGIKKRPQRCRGANAGVCSERPTGYKGPPAAESNGASASRLSPDSLRRITARLAASSATMVTWTRRFISWSLTRIERSRRSRARDHQGHRGPVSLLRSAGQWLRAVPRAGSGSSWSGQSYRNRWKHLRLALIGPNLPLPPLARR